MGMHELKGLLPKREWSEYDPFSVRRPGRTALHYSRWRVVLPERALHLGTGLRDRVWATVP